MRVGRWKHEAIERIRLEVFWGHAKTRTRLAQAAPHLRNTRKVVVSSLLTRNVEFVQ